jgi:membrane protease YdiL (CAAX protease family)
MPPAELSEIWLYYAIYVPVLITAIVLARILYYRPTDIGISSEGLRLQVAVGLTGILLGVGGYFLLRPDPLIAVLAWREVLLAAFILLLCTGFIQEFVFRGLIQHGVVEVFDWWGIVYVSLLFAVPYMGFTPVTGVAFAFVISLYFGWIVKRTNSILGVALADGLCNIVLYLILPFWF